MNQLQEVIERLGTAIINYTDNKIRIEGFYSVDRLTDWQKGIDCWQSKYLFDDQTVILDYTRIQDNALFIIKKDDLETKRYRFEPFFKGTAKYRNAENKDISRTFTLRKSLYSKQFHIVYQESNERQCIVCDDLEQVGIRLNELFPGYKLYGVDNKRIEDGFSTINRIEYEKVLLANGSLF